MGRSVDPHHIPQSARMYICGIPRYYGQRFEREEHEVYASHPELTPFTSELQRHAPHKDIGYPLMHATIFAYGPHLSGLLLTFHGYFKSHLSSGPFRQYTIAISIVTHRARSRTGGLLGKLPSRRTTVSTGISKLTPVPGTGHIILRPKKLELYLTRASGH